MTRGAGTGADGERAGGLRSLLPHGGSLPDDEWHLRHRVILALLGVAIITAIVYAIIARGSASIHYLAELASVLVFAAVAAWQGASRTWRSIAASMGLLTAAATLVDISGGLIEMHFSFFVIIVLLTLYEDWVPFLLSVAFVLVHHGVMGEIDPRAVFSQPSEWRHPWGWAALHALFMALAGVAGTTAWGFNERVRARMRATQRELERLGLTDPLTGLRNRRRLMNDLEATIEAGDDALLVIFDLDGFKEYNDRFGHPAGDSLLIRLTSALEADLDERAHAYRLGGDEFCVLAHGDRGDEIDQLVDGWARCFAEGGEGFSISASSGAARIPGETRDASEALRLCDRRMYVRKNSRRVTAARQTRDVLMAALAARHTELGEHLTGVATAAVRVGTRLGLGSRELQQLGYAAELHDVGKVAIPDSILGKPGPLDDEEWEFMRRHTVIGERILAAAPSMSEVAHIVRSTHERVDGGGYPDRIGGDEIPLAARIIAVCDSYDAMVAGRPYRAPATHEGALEELRRCAGTQFDRTVVDTFVAQFAHRPPASDPLPFFVGEPLPDGSFESETAPA